MYQVYVKKGTGFNSKTLIGEYKEYEKASERIETELAKDKDFKYVLEETTGHVNSYGDLVANIVDEN